MILKGKFNWKDPLLLMSLLSEEEKIIYETAHGFSQDKLLPLVEESFRTEQSDLRKIYKEMGSMGFLGTFLDKTINYNSYGLIANRMEYVDSAYRSMLSVQSSLVMLPIYTFGSEEQKKKYLPGLQSGELIGCFGLTEPNFGSNPGGMLTHADYKNGKFILNGAKNWITNSPFADVFIVWAKSKAHDNQIKGFILEKGMKGLTAPIIKGKYSLRASPTGMIQMEDVEIPESQMLPNCTGLKGPFTCLNSARYSIAWGTLGAASFCYEKVRDYVLERHQFNGPLAKHQLIQAELADFATEISIGLLGCYQAGQLKEQGELAPEHISLLKRNSAQKSLEIARRARDMLGANGISDEYGIIRHMLNLESCNTYEGTYNIHSLTLGRAITGIAAFS